MAGITGTMAAGIMGIAVEVIMAAAADIMGVAEEEGAVVVEGMGGELRAKMEDRRWEMAR